MCPPTSRCQRGTTVVVLEAGNPGVGASSRNHGMLNGGLKTPADLERRFGKPWADAIHRTAYESFVFLKNLIRDEALDVDSDPFVIAAAFDLTPGEARVALATFDGSSPEQIAQQHAVSINTIRAQLRSIFGKTGTTRQAELVGVLAALPMASLGLGAA